MDGRIGVSRRQTLSSLVYRAYVAPVKSALNGAATLEKGKTISTAAKDRLLFRSSGVLEIVVGVKITARRCR